MARYRLAAMTEEEKGAAITYPRKGHMSGLGTGDMKRLLMATALFVMLSASQTQAAERCWATAYCLTGKTASGTHTTANRTVAGRREWFGKGIHIWLDDGDGIVKEKNYLGRYIVEDTGGEPIKAGRVIDIYMPSKADCKKFGGQRILYELER